MNGAFYFGLFAGLILTVVRLFVVWRRDRPGVGRFL